MTYLYVRVYRESRYTAAPLSRWYAPRNTKRGIMEEWRRRSRYCFSPPPPTWGGGGEKGERGGLSLYYKCQTKGIYARQDRPVVVPHRREFLSKWRARLTRQPCDVSSILFFFPASSSNRYISARICTLGFSFPSFFFNGYFGEQKAHSKRRSYIFFYTRVFPF